MSSGPSGSAQRDSNACRISGVLSAGYGVETCDRPAAAGAFLLRRDLIGPSLPQSWRQSLHLLPARGTRRRFPPLAQRATGRNPSGDGSPPEFLPDGRNPAENDFSPDVSVAEDRHPICRPHRAAASKRCALPSCGPTFVPLIAPAWIGWRHSTYDAARISLQFGEVTDPDSPRIACSPDRT